MEKKVTQGSQSNIQVDISLDDKSYEQIKEKTLAEFGKDIEVPGYRKGHAPKEEILKKVNPQYLETAVYEFAVNDSLKELSKKYQLIGQIYDVNPVLNKDKKGISYKVDVYPKVEVANENYKNVVPYLPNPKINDKEKNAAKEGLQRQFAEYEDVDSVDVNNTFAKLELKYLNKEGKQIGDGKVFLAKEDFQEFDILSKTFENQKVGFTADFEYKEDLPQVLKYFKKDAKDLDIAKVEAKITEIKKPKLPELNLENLEKWFGKKYENIEEFDKEIETALSSEKERSELIKFIDDLVEKISSSFNVKIPKTLSNQETQQRLEHLKKQYGGEQNFEKMLKNMEPQELKKMYDEINDASKTSVEKFFILMKFAELNGVSDKIDFQKDLDLEKTLLSLFDNKK